MGCEVFEGKDMDKDGIGLDDTHCPAEGTWWRHECKCGHSWDCMRQVSTCWMCGELDIATADQATLDAQPKEKTQ